MITIREFVEKRIGGKVDQWGGQKKGTFYTVKGKNGKDIECGYFQCVSLIYVYVREVFGKELGSFDGGAMDGYKKISTFSSNYFDFYDFRNGFIPKRGDIIFFKKLPKNYNYGHIGIVLHSDSENIYYLDQNSGKGLGYGRDGDEITIRISKKNSRKYPFSEIAGFARYKNISEVVEKDYFDKIIFENGDYFFEDTKETKVKRRNAVKGIYFIFNGNFDGWEQVGITKNLDDAVIRRDFAYMLRGYLKNVRGLEVSYDDLINKYKVWSGVRGDDFLTPFELGVMLKNMKKIFG